MAKQVIWTKRAQHDRKEILQFWTEYNHSSDFSRKLGSLFNEAVKYIKANPRIGKPTDIKHVRIKIIRSYLMFYELWDDKIYILTIWDSRRDPDKLSDFSY